LVSSTILQSELRHLPPIMSIILALLLLNPVGVLIILIVISHIPIHNFLIVGIVRVILLLDFPRISTTAEMCEAMSQ
jgi:hypothetical protein